MRQTMLLILLLISTAAASQGAPPLPLRETVISDKENAGWSFDGKPKLKEVAAEALPGGKAILVTIPTKGQNPWDMQARLPMKAGIVAGDIITFGFFARAEKPDPGQTGATVQVRVQRDKAPYEAALEGPISLGPEWRFHCLTGPASLSIPAAELAVSVQLSAERRAVALGPYVATRIPAGAAKTVSGLPCGKATGAP